MLSHDQTIWIQAMINRATEILNIKNPTKALHSNNNQQSSSNINDLKNRISLSRSLVQNSKAEQISSTSSALQNLTLQPLASIHPMKVLMLIPKLN